MLVQGIFVSLSIFVPDLSLTNVLWFKSRSMGLVCSSQLKGGLVILGFLREMYRSKSAFSRLVDMSLWSRPSGGS